MPTFRIYQVTIIFSDGTFQQIPINCSNSTEAIKAGISSTAVQSVLEERVGSIAVRRIVKVECKVEEFRR